MWPATSLQLFPSSSHLACRRRQQQPAGLSRSQHASAAREPRLAFTSLNGNRRTAHSRLAATSSNAKALRAEIEELQEERELALRTAQLSSAKTKKLAKELQELHTSAFQAVKDNKEVLARRLLEDKMQISEELSSAEARSSANFVLANRLARFISDKQSQLRGESPAVSGSGTGQPEPPYLGGTPGSRPPQAPSSNVMDDASRDPWRHPWPPTQPSQQTPSASSSTSTGAFKSERELNNRFVELERQELERMMRASSASRDSSRSDGARDIDVSWEKRDSSRSTNSSNRGSTTGRMPPPTSNPASRPSSGNSTPSNQPPESSWQSAAGVSSRPSQGNSSSTGTSGRTASAGGAVGWWQTGEKLHQRLTGRSSEHEPTQPSDGGLSAVHQAEMILQLILDQQRQNAPLQGTDLVALAGRSLRAHLAGREIPSVTSTPVEIRRKVLRAGVNVCLHCLETGKNVLPTTGWAAGLSSIVEDQYPQLFIVSITAALDLAAEDAAAAVEEALISLCKAALADALPGANRGTASSDAGQASIKRLQQLHAALRPFVDGELAVRFSRVYKELFEGTNERDRLWLLLAFKSVAGKDAAALVACAEALGVSY